MLLLSRCTSSCCFSVIFQVSTWISQRSSGKNAETYLNPQLYQRILKTYSDSDLESNWNALKLLMQLFYEEQVYCAEKLQFPFNKSEAENSIEYVSKIEKFGEN